MRTTISKLALAALFTSLGLSQTPAGQAPDRTFYFTNLTSQADLNSMATALRTVVAITDISIDQPHKALVSHGTVDQMVATEWIVHQLDQPAGKSTAEPTDSYRMAGETGETIKVFRLNSATSNADLTAVVTALRTIVDLQRLFPFNGRSAIVARGSAEKIAASEWVIAQLYGPNGPIVSGDSLAYTMPPDMPGRPLEVTRILRMNPSVTNKDLTAAVTAIRTIADIQRLFPFETGKAMIMRAVPEKVAVAEWLVHELNQPTHNAGPYQTTLAGVTDGVVRLFYLPHHGSDATALATQIRGTAEIQRVFPFDKTAVVLRGRADQMSLVESLVAKFETSADPAAGQK